MRAVIFAFVVLLVSIVQVMGGCSITFNNTLYDFSSLYRSSDYSTTQGSIIWYLNVCGNLQTSSHGCNQQAAASRVLTSGCAVIGNEPATYSLIDPSNAGSGIQAVYQPGGSCNLVVGGGTYQLTVQHFCDMSNSFIKAASSDPTKDACHLLIKFYSANACGVPAPSPDDSGLSGGWVFVIILLVSLFLYFVIGMSYKYYKMGSRGVEIIPNVDCWTALPGLVKEGCIFSWRKMRGLCNKNEGYNTV